MAYLITQRITKAQASGASDVETKTIEVDWSREQVELAIAESGELTIDGDSYCTIEVLDVVEC